MRTLLVLFSLILLLTAACDCEPEPMSGGYPPAVTAWCQLAYECGMIVPDDEMTERSTHTRPGFTKLECIEELTARTVAKDPLTSGACLAAVNEGRVTCDVWTSPDYELPDECL